MPGTLPTSPAPESMTLESYAPTRISLPHSQHRVAMSKGGQRWILKLVWPPLPRATFAPLMGFFEDQLGRGGTFNMLIPTLGETAGPGDNSAIYRQIRNYHIYSNDFTNAAWTKVTCAGSAMTSGPYPGTSGQRWSWSGGYPQLWQNAQDPSQTFARTKNTLTLHIKHYTASHVILKLYNVTLGTGVWVKWKIDAGLPTYVSDGGPLDGYGVHDFGNGWYRLYIRVLGETDGWTGDVIKTYIEPDADSDNAGTYLYGAQLERGYLWPGAYYETTDATVQRMSHNPLYSYLWTPNTTPLNAGDFFRLDGKLYQVAEDLVSDTWGTASTKITPPVVGQPPNQSVIDALDPVITVALASDIQEYPIGLSGFYQYTANLIEAP